MMESKEESVCLENAKSSSEINVEDVKLNNTDSKLDHHVKVYNSDDKLEDLKLNGCDDQVRDCPVNDTECKIAKGRISSSESKSERRSSNGSSDKYSEKHSSRSDRRTDRRSSSRERRRSRSRDRRSDRYSDRYNDRKSERRNDRYSDRKDSDPYNSYLSWWFKCHPHSRPEYSLFVGDLTEDVDNYMLYEAFVKRYRSCRAAKVVYDPEGKHKGYGFVRFSDEHDLQRAVKEMQHATGIGRKCIRVGPAIPKNRSQVEVPGSTNYRDPYYSHYSQHYPPYSSYYNSWPGYSDQQYQYSYPQATQYTNTQQQNYYETTPEEDWEALEDPGLEIDVDKMNKEFMEQSEEFYDALERSRWNPLDSATSQVSASVS